MTEFTVLVLDHAFASSVALTLDVLSTAKLLAKQLGAAEPRWRVVSTSGGAITLSNGVLVETTKLSSRRGSDTSIWVVPGLGIDSVARLDQRLQETDARIAAKAIAAHLGRDGVVAAACSAVFLLQLAGALEDRKVTTTWWLAPHLQRLSPNSKINVNRMIVTDGNVVSAGAALAQTDLMLHLLRQRLGIKLADAVASAMLIDKRQSQAPFIAPAVYATGNALIETISARIEAALPSPPSMKVLASELCISERTLARHVRAATGRNPLALLQGIRMHKAQALLENSRLSVDEIAVRVGYQDATALRRLMKQTMQSTPRQIRQHNSNGKA
jgi:transcriptional regulator GlxA family with amidase domain